MDQRTITHPDGTPVFMATAEQRRARELERELARRARPITPPDRAGSRSSPVTG